MLGQLRAKSKSFTRLVAAPFAALGINPNLFSFVAVPLALAAAYFTQQQNFAYAFLIAGLAVSIDLFDGAVAELQNRKTLFGNYFETIVDKIVEIILFIGAAFLHPIAAAVALGFSMLASYAKSRVALVIITDNRDWPAIGEHAERMVLLLAGLLLSVFSVDVAGVRALEVVLWVIVVVTLVGSVQRIVYAKKLIEEAEKSWNVLPYLRSPEK